MTAARKRKPEPAPQLQLADAETGEQHEPQAMPDDLGEIVKTWPALSGEHRAIVLSTVRAFAGMTAPPADLPALSRPAAIVFDAMLGRPAHHAMTRAEMLDTLADHRIIMSPSALASTVIPQLTARGAVNTPRIGYSIPDRLRHCA